MIGKRICTSFFMTVVLLGATVLVMPKMVLAKKSNKDKTENTSIQAEEDVKTKKTNKNQIVIADSKNVNENAVKTLRLAKGKNQKLYAASKKKGTILWSSSNKKIADVKKNGRVYAKKTGKVKIIARLKKSKIKASITIQVYKEILPKKIKIKADKKKCYIGETISLTTSITPEKATKKTILWSSSNTKVAKVSSTGQVYAVGAGTCNITAQIEETKVKKKIKIKVKKRKVLVSQITTSYGKAGITIEHGNKLKLQYQVLPLDATSKNVKFYSSNRTIVSVAADGQLEALRPGTVNVTITAKDSSKKSVTIPVTVTGNTGFLTKKELNSVDLMCIDNLMIVAHPDDEAIFGGGHLAEEDYFVICLTNGYNSTRTNEFYRVLSASNDKGIILSYPDTIGNGVRSDWKNVEKGLLQDLELLLTYKDWDIVVTHNPQGEYGHQHHKLTNKYVTDLFVEKVDVEKQGLMYFGKYYVANQVENNLNNTAKLSEEILAKKLALHKLYVSQGVMIKKLSHMNSYEQWVNASEWK